MNVYFSDFFNISPESLEDYGAFNVSLINDLPVFIDPFLLFNSDNKEYQLLHQEIIRYITFLRDVSIDGPIKRGMLEHWFFFPEVKQNWLGYSKIGNSGTGLRGEFAKALTNNFSNIFNNFGEEQITRGSHLEKLCLIKDGVGRDNISDFTTNLIKGYLCEYTERFAEEYIKDNQLRSVVIERAKFNYELRRWDRKKYRLPYIAGDYILLTPKDILTKDEIWINKYDIYGNFGDIVNCISNAVLRAQVEDYFLRQLPPPAPNKKNSKKDIDNAKNRTIKQYPQLIDHYIRFKEDEGEKAVSISKENVIETETLFISNAGQLISNLQLNSKFYSQPWDTYEEAHIRVMYLKHVIEDNGGYRLFYNKGKQISREADLHILYRLTWYASESDVNSEVNNGRGPVDYKISRGAKDKTLVEFKLASNSQLKKNLKNQVEIYEKANVTNKSIKVIFYFSESEHRSVIKILNELDLKVGDGIVLIDADASNKQSASKV